MEWVVFGLFTLAALGGAAGVVVARRPVHSAMSLVLTLFSVAVFFVMQGAHFLAAVQVIVYAGAIVVLFLFVIMLLGIDQEDILDEPLPAQRPLAIVVGVALLAGVLLFAHILQPTGESAVRGSATQGDLPNVERIATSLFTTFLWPFEITSALLVIAVVGAVVLARRGATHPVDDHIGADPGSDEGPAAALYPGGTPDPPGEHEE